MRIFFTFFCALLVVDSASAQGAYNIAKQQARNASAQEAQHQQAIATTPTSVPGMAQPAAPQPNPALEATLQNIANLRADFQRFDSNPTNKLPLINDLAAAALKAQKRRPPPFPSWPEI